MDTKRQKLEMLQICTHSGPFHADESLAVYMLRLLPKFKDAKVVRSRNPEDWEASDIVVDVGAKYDGVKFFDHHQRNSLRLSMVSMPQSFPVLVWSTSTSAVR